MWKGDLAKMNKDSVELRNSFALVERMDKWFPAIQPTDAELGSEVGRLKIARRSAQRELVELLKAKLGHFWEKDGLPPPPKGASEQEMANWRRTRREERLKRGLPLTENGAGEDRGIAESKS